VFGGDPVVSIVTRLRKLEKSFDTDLVPEGFEPFTLEDYFADDYEERRECQAGSKKLEDFF
jgi:hypothetical protein